MKLTAFLVLGMVTATYADGMAQRLSLSLKNANLEAIFAEIASRTSYRFLYSDDAVRAVNRMDVQWKDVSIEQALHDVLKGHDLLYRIVAETILISKKDEMAAPPVDWLAQQRSVSGIVSDSAGEALRGVTISIKGQPGSIANTDGGGRFRVTVSADDVLVFTFLGYQKQEVPVGNQTTIQVTMGEQMSELEEVQVVATGYRNIDRKLFTGSASQVKAADVERNGVPDVSRMLEGQVAGVSIQNVSGTFGAAPKIRVRGATSLSGDNKPLWVIDGIILEDVVNISNEALSTGDPNTLIGSSVAGLNPDDIESFTILKDAAATALYGARAMNGVIVVNTKKGRNTEGKALVNYSGTLTTFLKPTYNQFDIMNSAEQMSVLLELENKGYYNHSQVSRSANGGVFYKMYNEMYVYDENTDSFNLKNTPGDRLNFLSRYANANTDWFDLLFKNSLLQEHSVSITTGSANSQTYASTSLMKDNGMTIGDNVSRYTANLRNNIKINDRLTAELLVNGSIRDQRSPGTLTRNSDPVYGQYSRDFDINPYSYALNTSRLMTAYDENGDLEYFVRNYAPFNVIDELARNYLTLNSLELKVQGQLGYKVLDQLTYRITGAYRYANTTRHHYVREGSNMAEAFRANYDATIAEDNIYLYTDPDDINSLPVVVLPEGGFYNTNLNNLKSYYVRQDLEYDDTFNDAHRLNVFGSMEIRYANRQRSSYEGIGYQYENGGLVNPNYRYFKKMIEGGDSYFGMGYGRDRFVAGMARVAYSYDSRYSINGTMRYDGSNLMGRSAVARWLPTWNVSGAWHITEEAFFRKAVGINKVITGATIRGTYGMTGNLGNATNSSAVFYNQITYRPYENEKESGIYINSLENSELTWEKMFELNIGTDFALFNKIDVTFDWYKRNAFDLIGSLRTSGIGGQFNKTANYADMEAHGVELTVGGSPAANPDGFRWRTQFNFGLNKNKITKLEINPNIWNTIRAEGGTKENYPQRGLYSIQFDGLDPQYGYPTYIGTAGQKTTYIRLQDDDVDYLKYHGPTDATFTGGFYNQFSYKDFSFSALFTFSAGNYIRLQPVFAASYSDMYTMSNRMNNRWLMPGDELVTNVPSLLGVYNLLNSVVDESGSTTDAVYPYNAYNFSTEAVAKGDFIRLKRISIDYRLPGRITSLLRMRSASLSLVGNNVALLYSDKNLYGADPEFFNNGGVAMPIPRQYSLAIKVGF